ncbi:hypothetical protein SLE2022_244980 [Rubroshorea leprosula]
MAFAKKTMLFFLLLALFGVSLGAVYKVGDSAGWTSIGNIDYKKWASSHNFHVGDSLIFEYHNQFHNVEQVIHQDFQSCNASSPVATYTSGSDSITLKRSGHYYFLCGTPGHCQAGQKVDILVTSPSLRPAASPAPHGLPPFGLPIDSTAPSPAQSGAPPSHHRLSLLSLAIIASVFLVLLAN